MKLSELKIGDTAKIKALFAKPSVYRQKLLSLGLLPGNTLKLLRVAPFGDPVQIQINGFSLSLRKEESKLLHVEKLSQ